MLTDITKLIAAFRNVVNAPRNELGSSDIHVQSILRVRIGRGEIRNLKLNEQMLR